MSAPAWLPTGNWQWNEHLAVINTQRLTALYNALRARKRHGYCTPHENVVPLTKKSAVEDPKESKRHDPHSRNHDIAAATKRRFCTSPDNGPKKERACN